MLPSGAVIFILKFFVSHLTQKFRRYLDKCVLSRVNWIKISFFPKPFGELGGRGGGGFFVKFKLFFFFLGFFGPNFKFKKIFFNF